MPVESSKTIHANCVSIDGKGLLILGRAGSGKSSLSLQLLGLGADLVSDDQTTLSRSGMALYGTAPETISGLIEVRNLGILTVPAVVTTHIKAVVDLDQIEKTRLPPFHNTDILGVSLPCLHKIDSPVFPTALLHYVRYGRQDEA